MFRKSASIDLPDAGKLRRFTPFEHLPDEQLEKIAAQAQWLKAGKRHVLMELGDREQNSILLIKGNILLEAADGRKRIIKHTDPAAHSPLSRLRPSRYRVVALTPVQYVKIDNRLLDRLLEAEEATEMLSSHYVVEEGLPEGDEAGFAAQALAQIYEDLHHDRLLLFSWRPIALALTRQMLTVNGSPRHLAPLVLLDPVLAIKTLRLATPSEGTIMDGGVGAALNKLGLEAAQRLAFMNLFRESCQPRTPMLDELFRSSWEQSIAVAHLTRELAGRHGLQPTDTLTLAGLLHNLGRWVLISYAYNFYREVSQEELKECLHLYSRETGRMVLSHWNLPVEITRAIGNAFEWSKDHGGEEPTLSDLLVAARLYTKLARKGGKIQVVPALRKLGLEDPHSPEGQALLTLANQAVSEARERLGLARPASTEEEEPQMMEAG